MGKDAVRGKIVGRVHEVRACRRRLSRAAHAALRVGNNAVIEIDEPRRDQRLQRQNDRRRVAAGIGNKLGAGNLLAMQLGHAIDSFCLRGRGQFGAVVLKGIDGAIGRFSQPPCSAQIDHADSALERLRHPLARLLVRRGEKQHIHAAFLQQLPGERLHLEIVDAVAAGELGMNLGERNAAMREILALHAPGKDRRLALEMRMVQQKPRQLRAGVSGDSHNRCLGGFRHDCNIVLSRAATSAAWRVSVQIIKTVSSPAMVPTTSGHSSRSRAAATGCAPPITVLSTT